MLSNHAHRHHQTQRKKKRLGKSKVDTIPASGAPLSNGTYTPTHNYKPSNTIQDDIDASARYMNPRKEYWYQTQPKNGMRRQGSSLQHGGPPIANSRQKPSGVGDLLQNWSGPRDAPPPLQRKSSAVRPRNPFKRKPSIIEVSDLNNPGNIETTQVPY